MEVDGRYETVLMDTELVEVVGTADATQTGHTHHSLWPELGMLLALVDRVPVTRQTYTEFIVQ